jgi:GntR family transcriptional regulator
MTDPEPEVCLDGAGSVVRQLCEQIRGHILRGALRPGEELPTVRAAAVGLAINPHAVEEAYAELGREGLLTTQDGTGVFVAAAAAPWDLAAACAALLERARCEGHPAIAVLETMCRVAADAARA